MRCQSEWVILAMETTQLNTDLISLLRPEVRAAIEAYLRRVIGAFANEVASVTLYGSQARGEAEAESDIDLLVVICHDTPLLRHKLADLAWDVQFEHNVIISDIIRSLDEFTYMQAMRFPYYQNLERDGIVLWKNTSAPMPEFA